MREFFAVHYALWRHTQMDDKYLDGLPSLVKHWSKTGLESGVRELVNFLNKSVSKEKITVRQMDDILRKYPIVRQQLMRELNTGVKTTMVTLRAAIKEGAKVVFVPKL